MNHQPSQHDWLAIYDAGFSFFPLLHESKKPMGSWKQYQTTKPDDEEFVDWLQSSANIGIATGQISGVVVLDLDSADAISEADAKGLPETVTAATPRGRHVFFRCPNWPVHNIAGGPDGKLPAGMDVRGDGGYVVGAGSYFVPNAKELEDGKREGRYSWIKSPAETPLADMPAWLVSAIQTPASSHAALSPPAPKATGLAVGEQGTPYGKAALAAECAKVSSAIKGQRNHQLNISAFAIAQLVAGGELDEREARDELEHVASNNGLQRAEIRATLASAFSSGSRQPRSAPEQTIEAAQQAAPPCDLGDIVCASDVMEMAIPPREWLVADWLPVGAVTTLFGDGGTGKSLVAIQMATAVAAGADLWGHATVKSPVLAFYCEDEPNEIARRQQAILRTFGLGKQAVKDSYFQSRFGKQSFLGALDKRTGRYAMGPLFDGIRTKALEMGARLVILDNISTMFGDNINDPAAVTSFMSALSGLALELNGAVLLLGHIAKGEGSRFAGTSAWSNAARNRIFLGRPETPAAARNPDLRLLTRDKANYGRSGEDIELMWHFGALVRPYDIDPSEDMLTSADAGDNLKLLVRLDELTRQRVPLSIKPKARNYAPRIIAKQGRFTRTEDIERMKAAMARLLTAGVIAEDQDLGWQLDNRKPATGLKRIADDAPVIAHPAAPKSEVENLLGLLRKAS